MARTRRTKGDGAELTEETERTPTPSDPVETALKRWAESRWPGAVERMAAASTIQRAARVTGLALDKTLRKSDLTQARFELLAALALSRTGAVPLGTLSERLVIHVTSVTSLVDRLESQDYVRRMPHPTDRRGVLAEITTKGRQTIERAAGDVAEIDFGVEPLTVEEAKQLRVILNKLLEL